jgi:hypothetical protein
MKDNIHVTNNYSRGDSVFQKKIKSITETLISNTNNFNYWNPSLVQ